MNSKIDILGVELDRFTAKEAMKRMMQYMDGESVSTVELVELEMLMQGQDSPEWKEQMAGMDMLLAADRDILESAGILEGDDIRDLENHTFLRLLFRYLERNRKRVFLLAGREEELLLLEERMAVYRRGITVAGEAVLPEGSGKQENVINEINGVDTDCILSVLPYPWQEVFITQSRPLLNARVWFGCGPLLGQKALERGLGGRLKHFILKKVFRYQVEKQKKE